MKYDSYCRNCGNGHIVDTYGICPNVKMTKGDTLDCGTAEGTEIFIVVKHYYTADSHLVRSNEAAFTTKSAAEDHIENLGNEEMPDTGGLLKYAVRPIVVHTSHKKWRDHVIDRANAVFRDLEG